MSPIGYLCWKPTSLLPVLYLFLFGVCICTYLRTYFSLTFATERLSLKKTESSKNCDTQLCLLYCLLMPGFICLFCIVKMSRLSFNPKLGCRCQNLSPMYIKGGKEKNCWLSKRNVLFCPLFRKRKAVENKPLDFLKIITHQTCILSQVDLLLRNLPCKNVVDSAPCCVASEDAWT